MNSMVMQELAFPLSWRLLGFITSQALNSAIFFGVFDGEILSGQIRVKFEDWDSIRLRPLAFITLMSMRSSIKFSSCITATDHLRSAAMRALGWDRAGASPHIRWSLMQTRLNFWPPSKMVLSSLRRPRRTLMESIRGFVIHATCLTLSLIELFIALITKKVSS